jgi:DNA mismatch endonuclease, patch repair protein
VRLFGNPDFVFLKQKVAVFVDGCFWHECPTHVSRPSTNRVFWAQKLARNRYRDLLVTRTLKKHGWHVLRIWQHALTRKNEMRCVVRIRRALGIKFLRA